MPKCTWFCYFRLAQGEWQSRRGCSYYAACRTTRVRFYFRRIGLIQLEKEASIFMCDTSLSLTRLDIKKWKSFIVQRNSWLQILKTRNRYKVHCSISSETKSWESVRRINFEKYKDNYVEILKQIWPLLRRGWSYMTFRSQECVGIRDRRIRPMEFHVIFAWRDSVFWFRVL